jgi:Zn-dependent protease with chaperone function
MQTSTYSVKARFPWAKFLLVIMAVVLVIVVLGFLVPQIGGFLISGLAGVGTGIYMFFVGAPTIYSVIAAVGLTAIVFVVITQRKYFIRRKVTVATNPYQPLQNQLQGSGMFNPVTTDVKQEENKT